MEPFEGAGREAGRPGTGRRPATGGPRPDGRWSQTRWWQAQCRDLDHAHAFLTVLPNRDEVVLVGPPGRTAALEPGAARELSSALRSAAEQARK